MRFRVLDAPSDPPTAAAEESAEAAAATTILSTTVPISAEVKMVELINNNDIYCPICKKYFTGSDYLKSIFQEAHVLFLANIVTHLRHSHISYYESGVRYVSRHHDYHTFKATVNERQKRQLIRRHKIFLREHGIKAEHFIELKGTTEKTLRLACRAFGGDFNSLLNVLKERTEKEKTETLEWSNEPVSITMMDYQFDAKPIRLEDYDEGGK
jgi:hypothetical protein